MFDGFYEELPRQPNAMQHVVDFQGFGGDLAGPFSTILAVRNLLRSVSLRSPLLRYCWIPAAAALAWLQSLPSGHLRMAPMLPFHNRAVGRDAHFRQRPISMVFKHKERSGRRICIEVKVKRCSS